MPSLAAYRDKTHLMVYPISDDPTQDIKAYYYRGRITPNWVAQFEAMAELSNEKAVREMCRLFCEVTASWDLLETDAPDSPTIPLTVEATSELGLTLMRGLLKGYIEAILDPEVSESGPPKPSVALLPSPKKGSMAS